MDRPLADAPDITAAAAVGTVVAAGSELMNIAFAGAATGPSNLTQGGGIVAAVRCAHFSHAVRFARPCGLDMEDSGGVAADALLGGAAVAITRPQPGAKYKVACAAPFVDFGCLVHIPQQITGKGHSVCGSPRSRIRWNR